MKKKERKEREKERKEREKERKGGRKGRKESSYYIDTIAASYLELERLNCPLYDVNESFITHYDYSTLSTSCVLLLISLAYSTNKIMKW